MIEIMMGQRRSLSVNMLGSWTMGRAMSSKQIPCLHMYKKGILWRKRQGEKGRL